MLEGKKVKILCAERAAHADAGVIVDYFRCTVQREALFAAQIPSKGELIVDGLQLDSEIVQDLAVHFAKLWAFCPVKPGQAGTTTTTRTLSSTSTARKWPASAVVVSASAAPSVSP